MKKGLPGFLGLLVLGAATLWFTIGRDFRHADRGFGRETAAADYAHQDDSKVAAQAPEPLGVQRRNPLNNVYWGDTHVHTHERMDAKSFGVAITIEDAYRFAKGEGLPSDGGEKMQLSRPLD